MTSYQNTGLTPSTTYSYTVSAYDAANNNSALSTAASATTQATPDTTAPSVPTNLTATAASSTQINLAWTASTDNVGVTGYKIFRNGAQVATSAVTSYQNTGLTPSTTYSYRVSAYDAANNNSAQSTAASATTQAPPDTTAPSVPTNLTATAASSTQINLSWTASTDNVGVTGYKIFRNGTQIATSVVTSYQNTGLTPSTTYSYTVSAYDAANNNSALSTAASATTQAAADTTSPSVPTNLAATAASSSQINLSWTASTDNVAVTGYKIYRNGSQVGTSAVTSYQDTGLTGSTTYSYTVSAYDAANNNSASSAAASATTQAAADTTSPSVPTNPVATAASSSQINLSWTASTDNVGVTGYKIYRNGSQVGTATATSYSDTGLTGSTTYSYTVSAYDAANNNSAPSSAASATTLAAADTTAPVISSENIASVSATAATMSWMTNEPADSQLEYGTTTAYGDLTPLSPSLVTAHSVSMTGLSADTRYHCRVRSRDAAGNLALSEDYAFTTATEAPTSQTCSQGTGLCFEATVPAGGGLSRISQGQGDLSVLFGELNASGTSWPVALANFGFTQNGVLVTEVGVPATQPLNSTRLFVDYGGQGSDSGVALVNPNDSAILVSAELRNTRGEFVGSSSVSVEGKGHTAQFVSQLIANMPNPFLGTLTLSSTSPFAAVNLRLAANGHGETLFSALPLADLNHPFPGMKLIFPQVIDGGGLPTQILLMNPSVMGTVTGFISFFDDEGNALALDFGPGIGVQSSITYSLPPNGMVKYSTTGLGALRVGYAVVTPLSGGLPVGSGVFSINGSAGLSSQAGVPNAVETTMSRLFVERATDPLQRDTGVAIVNRNSTETRVTMMLQGVDGSTQSGSLTLPPNGHVARFVSELFPGLPVQYQGVLTMTSPVPLAAMTLRQTFNQRNEPIYSTLPVADLTHPPEGPMYIPQVADGGGYQTQLILINTSNSISLVQIEFFNDNGKNISLPLK